MSNSIKHNSKKQRKKCIQINNEIVIACIYSVATIINTLIVVFLG